MKTRVKAKLALALVLSLLCTQFSAFAALPDDPVVSPQFIGLSSLYVEIDITSYGRADCAAEAVVRDGYQCDLTLALMQSSDQVNWTGIKTWTASGTGTVMLDKMYYVAEGYYYRTWTHVNVYDMSGNFIEGKSLYSGIDSYQVSSTL